MTPCEWFQKYLLQIHLWGLYAETETCEIGLPANSFRSLKSVDAADVKRYFLMLGYVNTDKRTYMAHTGEPHINFDKGKNTVQVSWNRRTGVVGVYFFPERGL